MNIRLGRQASARPLLEAAAGQFQRIGMTGWQQRAEQAAACCPSPACLARPTQPGLERPRRPPGAAAAAGLE